MLEEIKYSGQWWSPANPDNKVQGVLNFNQSTGARLELDGALEGRPNIINGLSEEEINNLICKHYQDRLKYYER